ncbi:Fic family protein [Corynebacterium hylobatis]|uniref:Fic family protein n=1 Tax=Corynebacterium hylobatis TaxID=1859290 RepID=A0A430HW25_9CORY|nr:Fic family protein [Corynebacterium hylobatis]RSZ61674.1 Fic family protein [Corynebacterium hylobatis]
MSPWPAASHETLPWVPRGPLSRRAHQSMPAEYSSAVVPGVAEVEYSMHGETAGLIDRATITVAHFDAHDAARLVPFAPLLLRSESVASSRIEQLTSSSRRVMEAEILGVTTGNAGLIVANTRQMRAAITCDGAPDTASLLAMHRTLLESSAPDIAGRFREEPVWIGGSDLHPVDALFVPPHARHIPGLMADLNLFLARTDIPTLVHAALAHAQLETIHPFADGNGRTGRALIHALLHARGLSRHAALPVSAGLLQDIPTYFDALTVYRDGDPEPIVRLVAQCAIRAAELGTWLATELTEIRQDWARSVTARRDAVDWRILNILLSRPVVTARDVAEELGVSPANIRKALERLEANGVVLASQLERNTRAWRAPDVLELLDAFAARSGRRQQP